MADDKKPKPRIKYFGSGQTSVGSRAADDTDNPLSRNFLPLDERGEYGKARWWALFGKKFRNVGSVEFG